MSEQILKALMQLFAIIARPESNESDRRIVVESFLDKQLNKELVSEYLTVFDEYYKMHQEKQKEKDKRVRRISSSSVRVLKICTQINEELTQTQKIIVLVQLLEFSKSGGGEVTFQELEFIKTVSDTFNIPEDEYKWIEAFVLNSFDDIPEYEEILVIDNDKDYSHPLTKHIYVETLEGQIWVFNVTTANMYLVRYIGNKELYMNSQLLHQDKVYVFNVGASIRDPKTKPIYYSDVISKFRPELLESRIVYEVKDVEFKFKGGKIGLHDISFEEESGRMVGIMGASGAGKSTLLNVLNGSNAPSKGAVLINGVNIHTQKEQIEGVIGHVSQDDLLIEELTVFQNLYYNAKLCFDNYTEEKIVETVNKTLQNLGLFEIKDMKVGSPLNKKISGGQRKRLNIALELIREPAVLFLDEPTSGLSSRDSENILDLLKELALKGKLVFVVIHQPSSDIFKMFDKLIILDTGGWLIYNGDPIESIIYFKSRMQHANWNESECHVCGNVTPEQIFNIVESNVLDEYGKITKTRKISPKEWNNHYNEFTKEEVKELESSMGIPEISFKIPNRLKQFLVFVKRDVLSKLANTQYMIFNLVEAPLLAAILAFLIKYFNVSTTNQYGYSLYENSNLPIYLFMAVIVAIFMGLTVSAEEIISDRKILKREAFLNLSWASYLLSKVAVQFVIAAIQALTFVLVGNSIIEIKGMYWQYWLVLFSAWTMSNMMGLVISDSFKTVVTIYILIPFLVIPQILLSGVMVKFEKLNPKISSPSKIHWYGEIMSARWAYEALAVYQFIENKYEKLFYPYEKVMSNAQYRRDYWHDELKKKIDYVERHYQEADLQDEVAEALSLLRYEISNEMEKNPFISLDVVNDLSPEGISQEVINQTDNYLALVENYNKKLWNMYYNKKDSIIVSLTSSNKEAFEKLKRDHANEKLEEFVKNSNETDRIIEYKGQLHQKIDPIYLDPESKFIKAHFYAPRKQFLGNYVHTFWVNILFIWFMTIILYIALYYRLLKRLLDSFEQISSRFTKSD
ncbi:MAG: ATP-binding cassette domain-containing protein [Bacteroidales bacterium]|nr:MAG: ATP-binding cassette domain-containing protein [Bacteroidales bacterium]